MSRTPTPSGCFVRSDLMPRSWGDFAAGAPAVECVSVIDGHPASLSWLVGVAGQRVYPLGVDHFGQSGDIPDLYRLYRLDVDAILEAAATACIERRDRPIRRVER